MCLSYDLPSTFSFMLCHHLTQEQTISCLLIQPNPDSALNSNAGHLLQEDFETFARQARLMTSIHALTPRNLIEAASAAKARGQNLFDNKGCKIDEKTSSSISARNTKITPTQIFFDGEDEFIPNTEDRLAAKERTEVLHAGRQNSTTKENDPCLATDNRVSESPRRTIRSKRPLLETINQDDDGKNTGPRAMDGHLFHSLTEASDGRLRNNPQVAMPASHQSPSFQATAGWSEQRAASATDDPQIECARVSKRVCSNESKQTSEVEKTPSGIKGAVLQMQLPTEGDSAGMRAPNPTKASKLSKPRVGLRRL